MEVSKGPFSIQNQGEIIFLKSSWNSWPNYIKSGRNFKRTGVNLIWNPILDRKRAPAKARFRSKTEKIKLFDKSSRIFVKVVWFYVQNSKELVKISFSTWFWIKNGPFGVKQGPVFDPKLISR